MNTDEIILTLEQAGLSENDNSNKLNNLLNDYPAFAGGHLLKALHMRNGSESESLWQKAHLYGGETHWFHFISKQLLHSNAGTIEWPDSSDEHLSGQNQDLQDAIIDAETLVEATDDEHSEKTSGSASGESLLIEPYHTVDYFASQGIRLKEEKLGNDPLSTQVKTFTQWLRSMKKIHADEQAKMGVKEEEQVIRIADNSNKEDAVLTETMAQVLLQQGKKSKAIELYRKLSLLHPEKSSYFASLIEKINEVK